jgi:anaerobic ribonucleoside-triphosphate reductase activating protein
MLVYLNMSSASPYVRVARVRHGQLQEGPGQRTVIWFAGCTIRCAGCINPHLFDGEKYAARPASEIVDRVCRGIALGDVGISVAGGEPFDQPAALAVLVREVAACWPQCGDIPRVIVYTGFTYEALVARREPVVKMALRFIDVLIDGPFVRALADRNLAYRGSSNQRVINMPATLQCGAVETMKDCDTPKIDIHPDGHITLTPVLGHLLPTNTSKLPTRHCGQDRPNEYRRPGGSSVHTEA